MTGRQYWLVKSEPFVYSWQKFVEEGRSVWDGVRNYTARNNLRAMKKGDLAFFYHSNEGKEIVGVARVDKEHYPDPTANGADWSVVEFVPVRPLKHPFSLAQARTEPALADMVLIKRSRLSVQPVTPAEFEKVLELSGTKF